MYITVGIFYAVSAVLVFGRTGNYIALLSELSGQTFIVQAFKARSEREKKQSIELPGGEPNVLSRISSIQHRAAVRIHGRVLLCHWPAEEANQATYSTISYNILLEDAKGTTEQSGGHPNYIELLFTPHCFEKWVEVGLALWPASMCLTTPTQHFRGKGKNSTLPSNYFLNGWSLQHGVNLFFPPIPSRALEMQL